VRREGGPLAQLSPVANRLPPVPSTVPILGLSLWLAAPAGRKQGAFNYT